MLIYKAFFQVNLYHSLPAFWHNGGMTALPFNRVAFIWVPACARLMASVTTDSLVVRCQLFGTIDSSYKHRYFHRPLPAFWHNGGMTILPFNRVGIHSGSKGAALGRGAGAGALAALRPEQIGSKLALLSS